MFLHKQNRIYHLRIDVPLAIVPIIGKKELRFTLKTGDKRVASSRSRVLSERVHNAFNKLRSSKWEIRFMLKQGTLTKAEVHQLLRRYVLDSLEDFQCHIDLFGDSRTEQAPDMLESLEFNLFESKLTMKDQQYMQHMGPVLDRLLTQMDRTLDRDSGQYKLWEG